MGLIDLFKPRRVTPAVISILPDAAKQEILQGRLPILNTDTVFLKNGEQCHYIDKAIYEKRTVQKRYIRRYNGVSAPGLFGGTRYRTGGSQTDVENNVQYDTHKGILYITNKRIIFVSQAAGFDRKVEELVALTPYANCVELQFSKENYTIFVPDGNVVNAVLQQIK